MTTPRQRSEEVAKKIVTQIKWQASVMDDGEKAISDTLEPIYQRIESLEKAKEMAEEEFVKHVKEIKELEEKNRELENRLSFQGDPYTKIEILESRLSKAVEAMSYVTRFFNECKTVHCQSCQNQIAGLEEVLKEIEDGK